MSKTKKPPAKKPTKPKAAKPAKPLKKGSKPKSAAKPVPPYATPEALRIYDFETQRDVTALEREVADLESKYKDLKSKAMSAKKMFDGCTAEMREFIEDRSNRRGKPPQSLFDKAERERAAAEQRQDAAKTGAAAATGAEAKKLKTVPMPIPDGPAADAWFPDDIWNKFPVDRLSIYGLTPADLKAIKAGECKAGVEGCGTLETIGDLKRFTTAHSSAPARKYTDLKGMGAAAANRLSEAEKMFWSAWKKGLDATFAVEMGFTKPDKPGLKIHEPGAEDGDDTAGGSGAKGSRKRKGGKHPLDAAGAIDAATAAAIEPSKDNAGKAE